MSNFLTLRQAILASNDGRRFCWPLLLAGGLLLLLLLFEEAAAAAADVDAPLADAEAAADVERSWPAAIGAT